MIPRVLSATGLLVLSSACHGPALADPSVRIERHLALMGTWLGLEVEGADRARALAASEAAVRALEATEQRLSTWSEDSEVARLNRAPVGETVTLSPELATDLARIAALWRATDGAFDPGLGALVAAWGLRSGGRQPSAAELAAARAVGGFAGFELEGATATRRVPLAAIEEGGFGKGIGLDAAVTALRAAGAKWAKLDFGGQIDMLGDGQCVTSLADPRDRARAVLELRFGPGSLATSGNSEHAITVDGVRRGHILDPRSGAPAPDFGSLSVWASDATSADALSKLYVLGPDGAFRWLAEHPMCELLALVVDDGRLVALASEGWRGRVRALVPELELRFVPGPSFMRPGSPSSSIPAPLR